MVIIDFIKFIFAGIGAALGYFFGEINGLLLALICLAILDYVSGVMLAINNNNLSSSTGFKGILRKIFMFSVVAVANILEVEVFHSGGILRNACLTFYIANESISILENACNIGLPLPNQLVKVLKQVKLNSDGIQEPENEKKENEYERK